MKHSAFTAGIAAAMSMAAVPESASTSFVANGESFDFGNVAVGTSLTHEITFTNVSATSQIFQGAGGGSAQFGGVQNCQGRTIASGGSCSYFYTFDPSAAGAVSDTAGGGTGLIACKLG